MSSAPISVALVGAGDIFSHHAAGMLAHPELYTVSCVCDPDKTRVAAASERCGGCPTFPTLTEALEADTAASSTVSFEAVVLMIPHHLHESIALQAFSAKKHTLLEKPLATTVESCRRILAAAEQSGVVFAVAENAQFIPDFVKAKQLIDSGAIGDVYFCKANLWESAIESEFAGGFAQGWRSDLNQAGASELQASIREMRAGQFEPRRTRAHISADSCPRHISGGGNTIDGGTHWVRALRMFMGEIVRVVAINERPLAAMAGESLTHAIVRFQSGKSASFDCLVSSVSATAMSSECSLCLCAQHSKHTSLPLKFNGFLCTMGSTGDGRTTVQAAVFPNSGHER
jgi:predicted dehydrogenase